MVGESVGCNEFIKLVFLHPGDCHFSFMSLVLTIQTMHDYFHFAL